MTIFTLVLSVVVLVVIITFVITVNQKNAIIESNDIVFTNLLEEKRHLERIIVIMDVEKCSEEKACILIRERDAKFS